MHDVLSVQRQQENFYGQSYWFEHQEKDLGLPNICSRARLDLPERCLYWLDAVMRYLLPPAKTLEIGCGHGGLVALMGAAGFESSGLELTAEAVALSQKIFSINMYKGELGEQQIAARSLDGIFMMDVVEHLSEPLATLNIAAKLLRESGVLAIQTPCYDEDKSYADLQSAKHPFLGLLQPLEHIYIFSQRSLRDILQRVGLTNVEFVPTMFGQYDMFAFASARPLRCYTEEERENALLTSVNSRLVLALLDLYRSQDKERKAAAALKADVDFLVEKSRLLEGSLLQSEERLRAGRSAWQKLIENFENKTAHLKACRWWQILLRKK